MTAPLTRASAQSVRRSTVCYQILSRCLRTRQTNQPVTVSDVRDVCLAWMADHWQTETGTALPPEALRGETFRVEEGQHLCAAMIMEDVSAWVSRVSWPDPDPEAAGRVWSIEISIRTADRDPQIALREMCVLGDPEVEFPFRMPAVMSRLLDRFVLMEASIIDGRPWELETHQDLVQLQNLVESPVRRLPVILLTDATENRDRFQVDLYVYDANLLAQELHGLAYVVIMPRELGFEWTRRVGKSWSAFNGYVRTYYPKLDFERDQPARHPYQSIENIMAYEYKGPLANGETVAGQRGFAMFLRERALFTMARIPLPHIDILWYRGSRLSSGPRVDEPLHPVDSKDSVRVADSESDATRHLREDLRLAYDRAEMLEKENERLREEMHALRQRLDAVRRQVTLPEVPIPDVLSDLEEWVKCLAGQVLFSTRALRVAARSDFEDARLVYRSLLLLAEEYRESRLHGGEQARAQFAEKLKDLGLEVRSVMTPGRVLEEDEDCIIPHPIFPDRRVRLDMQLSNGPWRDARSSIRVYFAWDRTERLVIVGWLPSIWDNRS